MAFGDLLGQILQQGAAGQDRATGRLQNTLNDLSRQGGVEDIFGQLQGRADPGRPQAQAGLGGLAEMAKDFLGKEQMGGLTTGQIGGIGAAAGALLGGGVGGAARGGIMAVLGTMAISALKGGPAKASGQAAPDARAGSGVKELRIEPKQVEELTGPAAQKLLLRAMIAAAKADGQIDKAEIEKIIGKIGGEGVTDAEKQFVIEEMRAPLDIDAIAGEVRSPAQAAEVYAASILAIDIDSEAEKQYLAKLANAMRMDPQTVVRLHQMIDAA